MPRHSEDRNPTLAILVAQPNAAGFQKTDAEISLDELARLVEGLGLRVVDRVVPRRSPARTVLGEGKREELAERIADLAPDPVAVVVDGTLEPGPHRELERALGVEVMDRTGVVLRVFEQRARTKLAKTEIELARLAYEAPRLRDDSAGDDREGGGGRGARGHTNVELAKQAMRERRVKLERELERLRSARTNQIARRRDVPRVALVGYTNAGKSSLLRALTGGDVLVEDALFATLDPTVRALSPATTPRILVSDTVGFVRNLPHSLVASFRSTLDEAREADLLLLVVDASDPAWREQLEVTRETLSAIDAAMPSRLVLNKIDRVDSATRAALAHELPGAIPVSAHDAADTHRLREAIVAFFERAHEADVLIVPFREPQILAEVRAEARILAERYDEHGARLTLRAHPDAIARWRSALPAPPPITTPAELLAAAGRYGLELTTEHADFDASGLDFLVLHAEDDAGVPWIVRTPRRPDVVQGAQREARTLRALRGAMPFEVPDWRVHARDVIAYPRLPGTPAWTLGPNGVSHALDPANLAEPFLESYARAIAALQSVPLERAADAGIRIETLELARGVMAGAMSATREVLAPPEAVWARWQRWTEDDAMWPEHAALVHGDLHPGHLLLDEDQRITGILDWTEARVSDPSIDLMMLAGCFGRAALEAFMPHFERAGGVTWPRIVEHTLERWAAYPVLVAAWALETGNEAVMEHARVHLANVTAEDTQRGSTT